MTGGNAYSETDTITGVPAGMNNAIFQSEWTGGQANGGAVGARAFLFTVPVTNGYYRVRLHFAELNKNAANLRLFDVRLENTTVLSNFDIWSAAGGIDRAIVREFTVQRHGWCGQHRLHHPQGEREGLGDRDHPGRRTGHHGPGRGDRADRNGFGHRGGAGLVGEQRRRTWPDTTCTGRAPRPRHLHAS